MKNKFRNILTEGLSDILYHWCSPNNCYAFLKRGKIGLNFASNSADAKHPSKCFYLSTSRTKSPHIGYGYHKTNNGKSKYPYCRIQLDGYALKRDGFIGKPMDYYGASMGKHTDIGPTAQKVTDLIYGNSPESLMRNQQNSTSFEFEDRIISDKPFIANLDKYITRIDILQTGDKGNQSLKGILELGNEYIFTINIYDNAKDFTLQTENTINSQIIEWDGTEEDDESYWKRNVDYINLNLLTEIIILLVMPDNTSYYPDEETYKLIYDYLEKYNLTDYYEEIKKKIYYSSRNYKDISYSLSSGELRFLNKNEEYDSEYKEGITLLAQELLNKYHVKSFDHLGKYFEEMYKMQAKEEERPIEDAIRCVGVCWDENGMELSELYDGEKELFWKHVSKSNFYGDLRDMLDRQDWDGYQGVIAPFKHKSKDNESFLKYIEHLMYNDNLSFYDGVKILWNLFGNDFNTVKMNMQYMFSCVYKPIEITKENFEEYRRYFHNWELESEVTSRLWGSSHNYWEAKNAQEQQITTESKKTIRINESQLYLLKENREGKNINLARKYLLRNGYSEQMTEWFLNVMREYVPSTRLEDCRFLLGAVRMCVEREIPKTNGNSELNQTIKIIVNNGDSKKFDQNFNGLKYNILVSQYEDKRKDAVKRHMEASKARKFTKVGDYTVKEIKSFQEAQKYEKYNEWCVCNSEDAFDSYTSHGANAMYFCLKNGFENIPQEIGENCPLDEYGLSMICVVVTPYNELHVAACRWNYKNGGNDHILDEEQLEDIMGRNFYETFKPKTLTEGKKIVMESQYESNEIGELVYSLDIDEDDYTEWLSENNMIDSEESKKEFVKDNYWCKFGVELMDSETFHHMDYLDLSYEEVIDEFGEKIANEMLNGGIDGKEHRIDMGMMYDDDDVDINDLYAVSQEAEKRLKHGEYAKNARGFILPNGHMVYTEAEHNMISQVPFINGTFDAIKRFGMIRVLDHSVDIGMIPTAAQEKTLMEVISCYSDEYLYLDLYSNGSVTGCQYHHPNWRRVIADIKRFFTEGIKPLGNMNLGEEDEHTLADKYEIGTETGGDISPYYHINENLDVEYAPADVDTSSFKKQHRLEPHLWKDGELDSKIRLRLLDIADDFIEYLNISWVKPKDIILGGSICNYNWSEYSDIDMHVIIDFEEVDERTDFVREYFNTKKNAWNDSHENLKLFKYPVELYVQDVSEELQSGGIYSLEKKEWLREPDEDDIKELGSKEHAKVKLIAAGIMTMIDDIEEDAHTISDKHQLEELNDDLSELAHKLKDMRTHGLETDGEKSIGNIVYKTIRRAGYLDKMWDLFDELYNQINSLDESKENKPILTEGYQTSGK